MDEKVENRCTLKLSTCVWELLEHVCGDCFHVIPRFKLPWISTLIAAFPDFFEESLGILAHLLRMGSWNLNTMLFVSVIGHPLLIS